MPRRPTVVAVRAVLGLLLLALVVPAASARAAGQDVADEVFYQFMPIAWRDSDSDASRFGDFGGMTASLDYLQELGVTAVWMNPVFPSPAYHGYQHGAADQLNPWFGDEAAFTAFITAAHAHGIRVFVDFVAYGISQSSIWFQSAYNNPASPYDGWLAFTNAANTTYQGYSFTTWNGATVGFINWDLRNAAPVSLVTQWARKWLDPNGDGVFTDGLDGYRLDHVWQYYGYGPDGWGYNIDSFWAPWRASLRAVNPAVFVFAEQADWGSYGTELLGGMDAAFTKPFEFAARDALRNENAAALYASAAATVAALAGSADGGTFLATIGDHDVDRLASNIGTSLVKGKAAAAVLLTQPFTPIIYYGDEIGMRGTKNTNYSGDAADIPMREPFKWNTVAGAPMSNYFVLNSAAYAGRVERNYDGRSVQEQSGISDSLLEAYRALIAARRGSVALRRGDYSPVTAGSAAVWAFARDHADQQVLVAINLSGASVTTALDLSGFTIAGGTTTPRDLLTNATRTALTDANKAAYPIALAAYGYALLDVDVTPPAPPVSVVDGRDIPNDFRPTALAVTQDNATGFGDNQSELDQLCVTGAADGLRVGLTGNLATDGTGLVLLLDTAAGGQSTLSLTGYSPPPSGPYNLTGTRLDDGFAPDHLLYINAYGGALYVDQFALAADGSIVKTYRGAGVTGDGDGLLAGGVNPRGMQVALDNGNTLGVTDTGAAGAATAVTGCEMFLPWGDLGLTGAATTIRVAACLVRDDGTVSNQWLPGLGGGAANLGLAPDLRASAGAQFAAVRVGQTTGVGPGAGAPADLAVAAHADSGGRVTFTVTAPGGAPARLALYDLRGRRVRVLFDGFVPTGPAATREVAWDGAADNGARLPSGVYLARLDARGHIATARVTLVR